MRSSSVRNSFAILPVAALVIVAGAAPDVAAQGPKGRFFDESLASQLVQQMAQRRIFEADDREDPVCKDKEMMQAKVVMQPASGRAGGVETRDWQEDWLLRRCNDTYAYRVFYSEVGKGGVTVSVAAHKALQNPAVVAVAATEPDVLSLQRPPLRGADVAAVQRALIKAGQPIKADGVFGPGTEKAVMAFQQSRGLAANGTVDRKTREALGLL